VNPCETCGKPSTYTSCLTIIPKHWCAEHGPFTDLQSTAAKLRTEAEIASLRSRLAVLEVAQEQHNAVLQAKALECEKALARVRDEALEKAIKICEKMASTYRKRGAEIRETTAWECADEIRILKKETLEKYHGYLGAQGEGEEL